MFENWYKTFLDEMPDINTTRGIAEKAWHARDAEIADLKRQLAERDGVPIIHGQAELDAYKMKVQNEFINSEACRAYVQEKVDQHDDEWIAAFGAQDLTPKVTPESLAKWVFRDVEQQLAGLEREKAEAVLDFTISALDYFSKKSTTAQQGERGIYSRTYQKFGEFVNSEHPKLSANRAKVSKA